MSFGYQQRINLALICGLLLVMVLAAGSYLTINSFLDDASREREFHDAMLSLQETAAHLKAAESLQRKYLISGERDDLLEYERSRTAVLRAVDLGRQYGGADTQRMLASLKDLVLPRLHRMDYAIDLRQTIGLSAAREVVASELSREQRESIDRIFREIRATESLGLQSSRMETEAGARRTSRLSLVTGVLSVVLLSLAIYLSNRHHRKRQAAEAELANSLDELQDVGVALRSSESQLRQVVDAVPVLIMYVDAGQRVLFHNRAYVESLGLAYEQADGGPVDELVGAAAQQLERPHLERAFRGELVTWQRDATAAAGVRTYEMKYIPRASERDPGEIAGVYVVGTDVTEFRRMDRMKSEFVATVSHELRTPLTSIRGSLGLIAAGVAGKLPERAADLVRIAKSNCERLSRLIDDILDIEKMESGNLRLETDGASVLPLLQSAIAANEAYASQHRVRLELATHADVIAELDPHRFVQVMGNLLSNAAKFSPAGAVVTVSLMRDAEFARVEVRDRGPGIDAEFRTRVFQKFSQADGSDSRQKGGTGLGLSIARALVEQMGGRLDFRNEPDCGCTFYFLLPLSPRNRHAEIKRMQQPAPT
ncbi:MAG: multi-sensor hybrid histidine kinase [Ramlibacter sp.]|nr:multi-sensor hybrid histidine kinase [Ramlibacter sp.]